MRRNKKFIGLFLAFTIMSAIIPIQAAEEVVPELIYPQEADHNTVYADQPALRSAQTIEEKRQILLEFEDRVEETLLSDEVVVDITGLDMDYNTFVQMNQLIPYFVKGIHLTRFIEDKVVVFENPLSQEETDELVRTVMKKQKRWTV